MEYWDIYDAEKRLTGRTMKRNDWCLKDGEYHLTVLGVVARPDGTYLITKRVMTKTWAPGWWEVSGGAAQAGESSEEAVRREVREETGLDVSNAEGGYVFTYKRENPGEGDNYFVDVYRLLKNPLNTIIVKEDSLFCKAFNLFLRCKHISVCLLCLKFQIILINIKHKACNDKSVGTGLVGSIRRCSAGRRVF